MDNAAFYTGMDTGVFGLRFPFGADRAYWATSADEELHRSGVHSILLGRFCQGDPLIVRSLLPPLLQVGIKGHALLRIGSVIDQWSGSGEV